MQTSTVLVESRLYSFILLFFLFYFILLGNLNIFESHLSFIVIFIYLICCSFTIIKSTINASFRILYICFCLDFCSYSRNWSIPRKISVTNLQTEDLDSVTILGPAWIQLSHFITPANLFFAFLLLQILGVWLAFRYRNQKDPHANPSAFLWSHDLEW